MEGAQRTSETATGAKRPAEGELNGSGKRMSFGSLDNMEVVFRILCPGTKTGSIIGKGGSIIKQIRDETGARIKVADAVPGVEERVVIVSGPEAPGVEFSPSQEGLFRVHQRIIEGDLSEANPTGTITTRLLVPSNQIGCILGKGGSIIAEMRAATGAQIRILPKEQLPGCALPTDETLQLVGDPPAVKAALSDASSRLRANPPRDRTVGQGRGQPIGVGPPPPQTFGGMPGGGVDAMMGFGGPPPIQPSWAFGGLPQPGPPPSFVNPRPMPMANLGPSPGGEISFRVLCPASKVGSIIGKGGSIVKHIREMTGAKIKVEAAVADCEERVITVTGTEEPGATYSPAQEGLIQVHGRVMEVSQLQEENNTGVLTSRLLVPTSQIGCIMGQRGVIIQEIRRTSGAVIRILSKDQVPPCAEESDELVQLLGTMEKTQEALRQITARLRANPPRDKLQGGQGGGPPPPQLAQTVAPPMYGSNWGFGGPPGAGMGGFGGPAIPFPSPLPPSISTINVSIPSSAAGTLIGKGGENIKKVRSLSGAIVRLPDVKEGSLAQERTVEISGTQDQIKMAHDLVQAFIAQATAATPVVGSGPGFIVQGPFVPQPF
eukprot:TRINITY_DN1888_c0_g1_i2.p1 TRINITY_DN1888_c0_g1~~TRINITY_DN1888_c0_g1_i2.p1  ORF type:complete len:604 (+),score=111.05 TRINITY_DN1888_c0_g1_i2:97-1908(+)